MCPQQAGFRKLRNKGAFCSYCRNVRSVELDAAVAALVGQLKVYQDRVYAEKEASKARLKRRMVVGLREVRRDISLGKARLVIVATDIEPSPTSGAQILIANRKWMIMNSLLLLQAALTRKWLLFALCATIIGYRWCSQ